MSDYGNANIKTKYGMIYVRNPGPFHPYGNFAIYHQTEQRTLRGQRPSIEAFKRAEDKYWAGLTKKQREVAKTKHILITGEGYRSFEYQSQLYSTDQQRYANPNGSNHVEGLAYDLDTGQHDFEKKRDALRSVGFHFAVEGEPWHASFVRAG